MLGNSEPVPFGDFMGLYFAGHGLRELGKQTQKAGISFLLQTAQPTKGFHHCPPTGVLPGSDGCGYFSGCGNGACIQLSVGEQDLAVF